MSIRSIKRSPGEKPDRSYKRTPEQRERMRVAQASRVGMTAQEASLKRWSDDRAKRLVERERRIRWAKGNQPSRGAGT